jgi:hypothetical protein
MTTTIDNPAGSELDESVNFTEGRVARAIEHRTAKLPSDLFLWAGLGALGASWFVQERDERSGVVLAQLAPVLLLMGIYNKLVKLAGHDQATGHED